MIEPRIQNQIKTAPTLHTCRLRVLNYDAMKRVVIQSYAALILVVALFSGCAGPPENGASSNANAPQQANSNSAQSPQVAQSNDPSSTPLKVQPMPSPEPKAGPDTAKPPEKPAAERNANTPNPAIIASLREPKLVAPDKKLDFGKQPQDKTLVRAIPIKNAGRADLKIESVAPS